MTFENLEEKRQRSLRRKEEVRPTSSCAGNCRREEVRYEARRATVRVMASAGARKIIRLQIGTCGSLRPNLNAL